MAKAYMIAATSSGCGKTTLTMGILRALTRRGIAVQPCKTGPDYIDTQYHHIASGRPSYNLDVWMNGIEGTRAICHQLCSCPDVDTVLVEGAMGMYDGANGMRGSCGELAELLHLPVILVVNARSMAHSLAPLLYGYTHYRSETRIAGVILNNVGSDRHLAMLHKAAAEVGVTVLGHLPRLPELQAPSRHLGLDISQREQIDNLANRVADAVEAHIDLSLFCPGAKANHRPTPPASHMMPRGNMNIYVARDDAFNFIYQESLERLSLLGQVHFFSPLADEGVPADADVVYLPGGYPEFYLPQLAASLRTQQSLHHTRARILAECGGMMYLGRHIDEYAMAGLLPLDTTMRDMRLHLGYRQATLPDGTQLRGHEFHYSHIQRADITSALTLSNAEGQPVDTALYISDKVCASYTHWSPVSLVALVQHLTNM